VGPGRRASVVVLEVDFSSSSFMGPVPCCRLDSVWRVGTFLLMCPQRTQKVLGEFTYPSVGQNWVPPSF
jgi:hypothetical protein